MKKILLLPSISLCFIFLNSIVLSCAFATVDLKDLTIHEKSEKFEYHQFCKSLRKWSEFQTKAGFAVDRINKQIRKDLTVGKKLKVTDCPPISDDKNMQEDYLYQNEAEPTGRLGRLLGILESVYFPGGTGRISNEFKTFDLKTGSVFNLKSCLQNGALEKIKDEYCKAIKMNAIKLDFDQEMLKLECSAPEYQLVIENGGINIATWVGKGRRTNLEEPLIQQSKINNYFKESCLP